MSPLTTASLSPKPVIYSQQYITMIEEEVNEISRAYVTDYWFDDVEKDVTDLLNSDEWETVPQGNNHRHARTNDVAASL
jgi:hypothetical protein